MPNPAIDDQQRAAKAEAKQQRDRDAARAMRDYEAGKAAVQANTARLRALRLAQQAAAASPKKVAKRTKVKR